jgi:hypothetical protein
MSPPDIALFLVVHENVSRGYNSLEKDVIDPWRVHSMKRLENELSDVTIKVVSNGSYASFILESKDEIVVAIHFIAG